MHHVPNPAEHRAEDVADNAGNDDEAGRSREREGVDGILEIEEMQAEDEIKRRLGRVREHHKRPSGVNYGQESSDSESRLMNLNFCHKICVIF